MNGIMRGMTERRTIRRFQDRQVPMEDLDRVLDAAAYSPNAGNRQTTVTLVCRDMNINRALGRINRSAFHGRVSSGIDYVSVDEPSIADDPSIKNAFYDAPTVITLFGPGDFLYTEPDCWIMASNIALAAYSIGIGSCILGRAEETFDSEIGHRLVAENGIPEGYTAAVHIALGYPDGGFPEAKPRTYPERIVVGRYDDGRYEE